MNECNSIETIDRTNLTEQTKIRVNKITEIENVFHQEISQRKLCSKKLSKYVTAFDYIDKVFHCFKCSNRRSIYLFVYKHCWCSCRNFKRKFDFNCSSNNRNSQKITTKHNKKQKKAR